MLVRKVILASTGLAVVVGSLALCGCAKPPAQPIIEQVPATQVSESLNPSQQQTEMPKLPPPKLSEVQDAVKRIFKDAVVIDAGRKPSFLVGDFNGDLSQDLAVILRPAEGKLSELNQQFPNWLAREPLKELLLPKSKVMAQPVAARSHNPAAGQTVRFEQSDLLLAIIHGSGANGWRDPEATQTHLLREVVGTGIELVPYKSAVQTYKSIKPIPDIYGDLIRQTLIGQSGFLHFAGGLYDWYDPKNYKPSTVPASGHAGMSTMRASAQPAKANSAMSRR